MGFPDLLKQIREIYFERYAFPDWILRVKKTMYNKYAKTCIVLYNSDDNESTTLENVKLLMENREPTNIAMGRLYDSNKLNKILGYKQGVYGDFEHSVNISVFVKTPMQVGSGFIEVNVLNVIAPAFDNQQQPDFKYFNYSKNEEDLIKRFTLIFQMILHTTIIEKFKKLYLCGFGLGAFNNNARHYTEGLRRVFGGKQLPFEIFFMDYSPRIFGEQQLYKYCKYVKANYHHLNTEIESTEDLQDSLFINAWDPWSFIGNGNAGDNSWDGAFGRFTMMSILAIPQLNKYIQYVDLATGDYSSESE